MSTATHEQLHMSSNVEFLIRISRYCSYVFVMERQMFARHSLVLKNTHEQPYMAAHV